MSTQSTTPAAAGVAPWRPLFLNHISKLASPEFVFSTLSPAPAGSPMPYLPRARYCVFRGMWAELPENKHYEGPKNEHVYESDMLTLTTDVRMQKVRDIFASSPGHGDAAQSQGSGGGGPVEAVFWVKEVSTQWRIKGEAYVIGPDIEGKGDESSGVRTVKSKLGERMRVVKEAGKGSWSWATEVAGHFGNMSPGMRGSFKNPTPGGAVSLVPADGRLALGQKVTDLDDEVARSNFRVVVIRPDEVEQIDLSDPDKARRWTFTYVGPEGGADIGEWKVQEQWP